MLRLIFTHASLLAALLVSATMPLAFAETSSDRLRVVVPLDSSVAFDQALTDIVREFNASQTRIRVELTRKGGTFQNLRSIIASHYANDLPDIALVDEADLPILHKLKIVSVIPDKWLAGKKFRPDLVTNTKCGTNTESHCSVPFQRRTAAWFFNRELLFKANQETSKIPVNWAELSALSQKLHAQLSKGDAPTTPHHEVWPLAIPTLGETVLSRWSALGLNSLHDPATATVNWISRMWQTPGRWLPGLPSTEEVTRRFLEQRAVVLLGSLEQEAYLKANAPFKFGSTLPAGDLPWHGTDFVVLKKEHNLESALEFLDYLYQPKIALKLFQSGTTLPVRRAFIASGAWTREIARFPLVKAALERKLKSQELGKLSPNLREEWARTAWRAVEKPVGGAQQAESSTELRAALEKILSTNTR